MAVNNGRTWLSIVIVVALVLGAVFLLGPKGSNTNLTGQVVAGFSDLELLSPNGEEQFSTGDEVRIEWEDRGVRRVNLFLVPHTENEKQIGTVAIGKEIRGNDYSWKVPDTLEGWFRVVIQSGANRDISDGYFYIGT